MSNIEGGKLNKNVSWEVELNEQLVFCSANLTCKLSYKISKDLKMEWIGKLPIRMCFHYYPSIGVKKPNLCYESKSKNSIGGKHIHSKVTYN